jgi:uncharacterized protein (TIGR03435 family)
MKLLLLLTATAAFAQSPAFEVASIKPSPPGALGMRLNGGPGTSDPGHWVCDNIPLSLLVSIGYDLRPYQLTAPSWVESTRFNVTAKLPPDVSQDDFRAMVRTLLATRFGLQSHHDKKEMAGYELVVARNGSKLKPAGPLPAATPRPSNDGPKVRVDSDGFPVIPPGLSLTLRLNGRARTQVYGVPISSLVATLALNTGRPVVDATGLTGKYDYSLFWVPEGVMPPPPQPGSGAVAPPPAPPEAPGPTIFAAVQEQLGLKLESKKVPVDILIVDHIEKTPTEN